MKTVIDITSVIELNMECSIEAKSYQKNCCCYLTWCWFGICNTRFTPSHIYGIFIKPFHDISTKFFFFFLLYLLCGKVLFNKFILEEWCFWHLLLNSQQDIHLTSVQNPQYQCVLVLYMYALIWIKCLNFLNNLHKKTFFCNCKKNFLMNLMLKVSNFCSTNR